MVATAEYGHFIPCGRVAGEEVVWPDACLGIPMRSSCAPGEVPGYRVDIDVAGARYEYRSPAADPLALSLAAAPDVPLPEPVLRWEGEEAHPSGVRCVSLRLYPDGRAAFGYCDGPHAVVPFLEARRREWADLHERFQPFTYQQPAERLVFEGAGHEEATDAWRRAMAAWAGLTRLETAAGRSSASIGTAFVWQREAANRPGFCEFLTVELYGRAFASRARCGGGDAVDLGEGWLSSDAWTTFDRWYYDYGSVEATVTGAMLHFFGQGVYAMPQEALISLAAWAETAFARLTNP